MATKYNYYVHSGIIAAIFGLMFLLSNPWDFASKPSVLSVLGIILLIGGVSLVMYGLNK